MTFVVPGLTWQDDVTQQAISRELAKLRNTPLQRQATPPDPRATYGGARDRKLRPGQAELNTNLQQYLSSLGFFQQPDLGGHLGLQQQVRISSARVSYELAYLMSSLNGSAAPPPVISPISPSSMAFCSTPPRIRNTELKSCGPSLWTTSAAFVEQRDGEQHGEPRLANANALPASKKRTHFTVFE